MSRNIRAVPLSVDAIAPFGDVIEAMGTADKLINKGLCGRYHNLARLDFGDGRAGISVFKSQTFSFPFQLDMMERHPQGSQAFLPMYQGLFLVVVAKDENGVPGKPLALVAQPGQGVNIGRNVWHGVLCPLQDPGLFAVVDRIGGGANLEEYWFDNPWTIERG